MDVQHAPLADTELLDRPYPGTATLWAMRKKGLRLEAEIVLRGDQWELRLLAQGIMFMWRRFALRASAVAYADLIQQDLELDLWY